MNDSTNLPIENEPNQFTGIIQSKLANPAQSSDIDLHGALNEVLKDVGLSTADSGGKITFHGRDPIIPALFRFGSLSAIALAAKAVGVAALWRLRTGELMEEVLDAAWTAAEVIELGLTQKATPERGNELLRSDVNPKRSQGS